MTVARLSLTLPLSIALALTAGSLCAQDADSADDVDATGQRVAPDIDEITVTGVQADVTNIQSESQAVTAFSMEDLDRSNIVAVDDLAFNVPALHVGQTGSSSIITLRGIGTENASITGEPGLQFHVDGVNYPRPGAARVAFFDLEGLQVLRGPQGYTGGKNATAGHIQVITRKPSSEFETALDYQRGSYSRERIRGALNLPISEYVQTRFAFYRMDHDGYQENLNSTVESPLRPGVFNNSHDYDAFDADDMGWRGHLRLLNDSETGLVPREALLSYSYFEQKGVGPSTELQKLPPHGECTPRPFGPGRVQTLFPNFAACAVVPGIFPVISKPATDNGSAGKIHRVYKDKNGNVENIYWGWAGTLDWEFDALPLLGRTALKSITSYQDVEIFQNGDRDGTDLELFWGLADESSQSWVQELQWQGTPSEWLDFQVSLFYAREKAASTLDLATAASAARIAIEIDQDVENTSFGFALNTNWYLREDLTLTVGGRWIRDRKETFLLSNAGGTGDQLGLPFQICTGGAVDDFPPFGQLDPPNHPPPTCDNRYRHLTGNAKLQWFPTDESQFYGGVSSGFKSGGFAALEFGTYEPEYIWSFEVGNKSTLFEKRLTLNLAAYFYHYRNLQLTVTDGPSTRTDNGDAEIQGLELEFAAEPFPGLRLNGQGTYTDSEFTDYLSSDPVDARNAFSCNRTRAGFAFLNPNPCLLSQFKGNQLSRAPELSVTLGAEYDIYLGKFGTLTPRAQYYWQDDTFYRGFNRTPENSGPNCPAIAPLTKLSCGASIVNDLQSSYYQIDIKTTWKSPDEKFWFEAGVQNLTDQLVYQNVLIGSALLGNPGFAWYGPPRTYTLTVGFRY